jgi:ATP-dependent Clp protease ATP-binding subunit ClpB
MAGGWCKIIVFHSLSEEHLMRIVDIQIEHLHAWLRDRHIQVELTPEARRHLVRIDYDPSYGARPLKRAIQKNLETQLGFQLLEGKVSKGQNVLVDYDQDRKKLIFSPQSIPVAAQVAAAKV